MRGISVLFGLLLTICLFVQNVNSRNYHIFRSNDGLHSFGGMKKSFPSLVANLPEVQQDEIQNIVQLKEFIPESVLHRRLPWSLKVLLKFFKNPLTKNAASLRAIPVATTTTTMSRVKLLFPFLDHPWVKPLLQRLSPVGRIIVEWVRDNKEKFIFGTKIMVGVYFLMAIARRIVHWYTGVAEYELLLDQHDYDYQTYGVHMDGFGSWILSRVDKMNVENFGYRDSYYRIEAALNKPCFPYAMNTYALHMGNEVADVVSDLDVKVRAMRKRYQRIAKSVQKHQEDQQQLLIQRQQSSRRFSFNNNNNKQNVAFAMNLDDNIKEMMNSLQQESDVVFVLQKSLLILSVRQADAYLRTTRMLILMEANNCEDLLKTWREKVVKKSQTLRIPVFQNLLAKIIGFTTGSRLKNMSKYSSSKSDSAKTESTQAGDASYNLQSSTTSNNATTSTSRSLTDTAAAAFSSVFNQSETTVNDDRSTNEEEDGSDVYTPNLLVKDLNAKEKVVLLENILKNLYIVSGRIQRHLESLQQHAVYLYEPNDEVLREHKVWQDLEMWVSQTSSLTLEAVHALSFQPAVLAAKSKAFETTNSHDLNPHALANRNNNKAAIVNNFYKSLATADNNKRISAVGATIGNNGFVKRRLLPNESPSTLISTSVNSKSKATNTSNTVAKNVDKDNENTSTANPGKRQVSQFISTEVLTQLQRLAAPITSEEMDPVIAHNHLPVIEFFIPVSPATLVEHGILSTKLWERVVQGSGGRNIRSFAWQLLNEDMNLNSSSNNKNAKDMKISSSVSAVREFSFQPQSQSSSSSSSSFSQPASTSSSHQPNFYDKHNNNNNNYYHGVAEEHSAATFAPWAQQQCLVQLVNLAPHISKPPAPAILSLTNPLAASAVAANAANAAILQYSMVMFQQFFAQPQSLSLTACNATSRWTFSSATAGDVAQFSAQKIPYTSSFAVSSPSHSTKYTKKSGERRKDLGTKVSAYMSNLFQHANFPILSSPFPAPSAAASSSTGNGHSPIPADHILWTKVQVTVDIQVRSSMYRYFIASVVLTETKKLAHHWKQVVDDYFLNIYGVTKKQDDISMDKTGKEQNNSDDDDENVQLVRRYFRKLLSSNELYTSQGATIVGSNRKLRIPSEIPGYYYKQRVTAEPLPNDETNNHSFSATFLSREPPLLSSSEAVVTAAVTTTSVSSSKNREKTAGQNNKNDGVHTSSNVGTERKNTAALVTAVAPVYTATLPSSYNVDNAKSQGNSRGIRSSATASSSTTPLSSETAWLYRLDAAIVQHERHIVSLRSQWQTSGVILKDLTRVSQTFANHLQAMGLRKRPHQGIYGILRARVVISLAFWTSLALAGFELNKRSEDISWGVDFLWKNSQRFIKRRVMTPTLSIVNDVILNKRMKITDAAALTDSKRSLRAMLYDFLLQHNPGMAETERQKLASNMDMRPISEEYEKQLKHPMRNIVTGSIARLVLIQLQFVKKELLVAMQAIDELFNANQVNLQLLAVTPAILAIFALQVVGRLMTSVLKATTKGQGAMIESATAVYRDVKMHLREMERILVNSEAYRQVRYGRHSPATATAGLSDTTTSSSSSAPSSTSNENHNHSHAGMVVPQDLTAKEWGHILSILYRLNLIMMIHSGNFEAYNLQQLQEDLRDLTRPYLSVQQRLSILERIHRHYAFLHTTSRRMFGGRFMQ